MIFCRVFQQELPDKGVTADGVSRFHTIYGLHAGIPAFEPRTLTTYFRIGEQAAFIPKNSGTTEGLKEVKLKKQKAV